MSDFTSNGSITALKIELERIEALLARVRAAAASASASFAGPIVATEALASAFAGLPDGEQIMVLSERSIWSSDPTDVRPFTALDANKRIPRAGGGSLTRTTYADPKWRYGITDVYIDPSNVTGIASNENKGIHTSPQVGDARAPLLTWQELFRRWGNGNTIFTGDLVGLSFQVHILSDEPAISAALDPATQGYITGTDTFPRYLGEANVVVLAGNLDGAGGFTAQNPAVPAPGGAAAQIKVGATVWGPFIGKRIRFTATGAVATILKDLGAGSARVSQPQITNEPLFFVAPTNANPANGAAFVVEDLVTVNTGNYWTIGGEGSAFGFGQQVNVADINVMTTNPAGDFPFAPQTDGTRSTYVFYQCSSDRSQAQDAPVIHNGCTLRSSYFTLGNLGAGAYFGGAIIPGAAGGIVVVTGNDNDVFGGAIDFNTYVQGVGVMFRGGSSCGIFSCWDAAINANINPGGHGVLIGGDPNLSAEPAQVSIRNGPIFGTGAVGKGLRVAASSRANYRVLPNITGTTGDLQLGDSAVAWWWNPATAVYNPVGAGSALSWANLTAPALFNGGAHEPHLDAHINIGAAT